MARIMLCMLLALVSNITVAAWADGDLADGFRQPPDSAKSRVYWWWLNSLVSKEGITRDLEEYRAKGIGGVLLFDAGGPAGPMPAGPRFMGPEWREMVKHTLREADRLGLEVSVNLCSGWDSGGPWITPEHAAQHFVQSELHVVGPKRASNLDKLPRPPGDAAQYRTVAVQAFREKKPPTAPSVTAGTSQIAGGNDVSTVSRQALLMLKSGRESSPLWSEKGSVRALVEAPMPELPTRLDEPVIAPASMIDLTAKLRQDGRLDWDVPEGEWTIVQTGYTMTGARVSCSSPGGDGLEMDWFDAAATDLHFRSMAAPLCDDAGPLAGKSLKYFHDDSWEVGLPNWTHTFLDEFQKFRGYDARPYLPVLAGRIVDSAAISDRFLHDFRKTVADCLAENHYARLAALAHTRGVKIHCEAGGPCYPKVPPMDALRNLGRCDVPMGEFWQSAHWKENGQNHVTKQTACAAHIYGRTYVAAEAFTKIGPHYEESPANLKPTADIAFCEGINRLFIHASTSSRTEDGQPGYEYFAGTHFNRNVTWWQKSAAWLEYLARCQYLLQQGRFTADVCLYNGDGAPNFVEPKHVDPSLGPGYDYDVCNADVLLTRMSVRNGRIMLPDGMSYRLLTLPDRKSMPVEVLRKIKELVEAGATVVGPPPFRDSGLRDYPQCDETIRTLAAALWGEVDGKRVTQRNIGRGRVVWGRSLRNVLLADGVQPDFEHSKPEAFLDFIHRTADGADIYFVANRSNRWERLDCTFRVAGRQPEIWDPIHGSTRDATAYRIAEGRTTLPLEFAPYGSMFFVFRKPSATMEAHGRNLASSAEHKVVQEIPGPWTVEFDPAWNGPPSIVFSQLEDWTKRQEPCIKFYSGTAKYTTRFDLPHPSVAPGKRIFLDLGDVKEMAEVRLNGKNLGVVWCPPWRIEITEAVRATDNQLAIEVVNLWINRLIGDSKLPADQRQTRTNIPINSEQPLVPSGLIGPVQAITTE